MLKFQCVNRRHYKRRRSKNCIDCQFSSEDFFFAESIIENEKYCMDNTIQTQLSNIHFLREKGVFTGFQ